MYKNTSFRSRYRNRNQNPLSSYLVSLMVKVLVWLLKKVITALISNLFFISTLFCFTCWSGDGRCKKRMVPYRKLGTRWRYADTPPEVQLSKWCHTQGLHLACDLLPYSWPSRSGGYRLGVIRNGYLNTFVNIKEHLRLCLRCAEKHGWKGRCWSLHGELCGRALGTWENGRHLSEDKGLGSNSDYPLCFSFEKVKLMSFSKYESYPILACFSW